jgi:hypothetical protein
VARAFARARLGNIDPGSRRQRNGGVNASPFAPGQVLRPSSTSIAPLTAGLSRTAWAETELEETDWLGEQDSNRVPIPKIPRYSAFPYSPAACEKHYGCSNAYNRGTCTNRLTTRREVIEASVLSGLKTHLMQPDLVKEFVAEYHREAEPGDGRVRGGP